MIDKLLNSLDSPTTFSFDYAMEAESFTDQVSKGADALGAPPGANANTPTGTTPTPTNDNTPADDTPDNGDTMERDGEKTDIFGGGDDNTPTDDTGGDAPPDDTANPPAENADEPPEGDAPPEGVSDNTEGTDPTDPNADEEAKEEGYVDKNTVRDNLIDIYNIINSNLKVLSQSLSSISNEENIRVVNKVISYFRECENTLYDTITNKIATAEYTELIRIYITVKHIYELSIQMLKENFIRENSIKKKDNKS